MLLTGHGGLDQLVLGTMPDPVPGDGEILVEVHAASVNAADHQVRRFGQGTVPLPHVLGRDFSGVVAGCGVEVSDLAIGDAVFGVLDMGMEGTYAERLVVPATLVVRKPDWLSHTAAAAVGLIGITAVQAIEDTARLKADEAILIQGGAGGVAGFAIGLAKHLGATVSTTTSTANADYVCGLGADVVIDYTTVDFENAGPIYDVVFDTVGGDVQPRCLAVLKPGGRLVWIAFGSDGVPPSRPGIEVLRPTIRRGRAPLQRVIELLQNGAVVIPPIRNFNLVEAAEAQQISESRRLRGKLVLAIV